MKVIHAFPVEEYDELFLITTRFRTCQELGLVFPIERFYAMAGAPVKDIFQTLITEQKKEAMLAVL